MHSGLRAERTARHRRTAVASAWTAAAAA
jgi:hypothetical protein